MEHMHHCEYYGMDITLGIHVLWGWNIYTVVSVMESNCSQIVMLCCTYNFGNDSKMQVIKYISNGFEDNFLKLTSDQFLIIILCLSIKT